MKCSGINRRPRLFAFVCIGTVTVLCLAWMATVELGFGVGRSRVVHVWELCLVALGVTGCVALSPRVRVWDFNGARSVVRDTRRWNALLVMVVVLMPLLARTLLGRAVGDSERVEQALPWELALALSFTGLLTVGVGLLFTAILGRWLGAICTAAAVSSLWWVQGLAGARSWVPLHDSADLRWWPVLASTGLISWGIWCSGRKSVQRLRG